MRILRRWKKERWRRRWLWANDRLDASVEYVSKQARRYDRESPWAVAGVWGVVAMITFICWGIVGAGASVLSVLLLGLLVPLGTLELGLQLTRGSLADAERRERAMYDLRGIIPEYQLPERLRQNLQTGERVIYRVRQHPIVMLAEMTKWQMLGVFATAGGLGLMFGVGGGSATGSGFLLLIVGVLPVLFHIWDWSRTELYITDRRILRISGILSRDVGMMDRSRLVNVKATQSAMSRLLAGLRIIDVPYGRLHVETAGQEEALRTMDHMSHPTLTTLLMLDGALEGLGEEAELAFGPGPMTPDD